MTKDQLATEIHLSSPNKKPISKANAVKVIEAFTEVVTDAVSRGEMVRLRKFGTFRPIHWKEHKGQIVATKTTVVIPAFTKPIFTFSKS